MKSVFVQGVNTENLTQGAVHPLILESWRFGFTQTENGEVFGHRDDGQLVSYEAAKAEIDFLKARIIFLEKELGRRLPLRPQGCGPF